MEAIKQWYHELTESDQKVVLFAILFFSLVIVFFTTIYPLIQSVDKAKNEIDGLNRSLDEWQKSLPLILANKGNVSGTNSKFVLSNVITASTREFQLTVSRVQEKSQDEIQVWFDNVEFNQFVLWLTKVQKQYSISVATVNVRSKQRDGVVSIDLKLIKG
ncbi:MAG: type II secretion system protein M [Gammaproteobacteria bacterium]|nr:type II secretion system protein M [Gammaproteobacteria bacterium]